MTYKEFTEQVKEQISAYLPEEYAKADIAIQEIIKNNDQKFYALCIKRPEDRVVPSLYLENYYQMHQNGREMESILYAVAQKHSESVTESMKWMPFHMTDYDEAKDRLYVTVLNKNNNQKYLQDAVCMDIPETDITAAVRVLCENQQEEGTASFLVRESLREMWGVSGKHIYEQALKNTEKLFPAEMMNMEEVLFHCGSQAEKQKELLPYEIYVLTNQAKINGATVMLYPNLLQEIGEATQSRFFILPSSIHELILMKDNGEMSAEELQRMVMEVNRTQVEPEEVLSDEVYSYDYREKKLTMETEPSQTREFMGQVEGTYECEDFMQEADRGEMER